MARQLLLYLRPAEHLLDGTDTEWMSTENTASIEIDFGCGYAVEGISFQWWGISRAKRFRVHLLICEEDGDLRAPSSSPSWLEVFSESDFELVSNPGVNGGPVGDNEGGRLKKTMVEANKEEILHRV
eukprot:TRINITY_DN31638_c0_g1_i2.p1 TRINITY_DN31638_c0_g1~~TRINITY_DN31638_c0_g1_i2.p1  ORF type:complete len:127 (+),score=6.30 TRINITY_DN31638_c0_g1_i2:197-577(+)